MKIRLLIVLPALLLAAAPSRAQTFEPGLLVRANGDTLRGQLENGFWADSPEFIRFRATPTAETQLFQPRQLRAVSFRGGRYFRYEVLPINHAAEVNMNRLPRGYAPAVQNDSLLAEVLVESPVSLLRVVYNGIPHYLIRRPDRPCLELSEQKYLRETPGGTMVVADGNNYRSLLGIYFGDCPAAAEAAQSIRFTVAGLASVLQAYNQACNAGAPAGRSWLAQASPRRRLAVQGGVLAGARYNHIAAYYNAFNTELIDTHPHPEAGLYAEVFLPSRTTAVYGELTASPFQSRYSIYSFTDLGGAGGSTRYIFSYADYRAWLGTARIGLRRYAPLRHDQQLVIGLSYGLGWVLRPRFSTITTGSSNGPTTTQPVPADFEIPRLGYSTQTLLPALALGWRARRLTLTVEGQRCYDARDRNNVVGDNLFGSSWFVRLTASYRLGRNPDAARP